MKIHFTIMFFLRVVSLRMIRAGKPKFSVFFYDALSAILLTNFILLKIFTNSILKLAVFSVKLSLALKNVKIGLFS